MEEKYFWPEIDLFAFTKLVVKGNALLFFIYQKSD